MTKSRYNKKKFDSKKNEDSVRGKTDVKNEESQDSRHVINTIITVITIMIALLGGVPGAINIIDYFGRSSVIIDFNKVNSFACSIKSENKNLDGRLSILLYRMTIAGKGLEPFYIKQIKIELKSDMGWIEGEQFSPTQKDVTDREGITMKAVGFSVKNESFDFLYVEGWIDFVPGEKSLSYGEPVTFSYAAVFDINIKKYKDFKELRINVSDYLGNEYEEIVDISAYMERSPNLFLMQDPS